MQTAMGREATVEGVWWRRQQPSGMERRTLLDFGTVPHPAQMGAECGAPTHAALAWGR